MLTSRRVVFEIVDSPVARTDMKFKALKNKKKLFFIEGAIFLSFYVAFVSTNQFCHHIFFLNTAETFVNAAFLFNFAILEANLESGNFILVC